MRHLGTHRFRLPGPSGRLVRRVVARASRAGAGGPGALEPAYARLLDGDRLWLGVPDPLASAGPLGLRDLATGEVHVPPEDESRREGELTWVRWLLTSGALPGEGAAEFELVTVTTAPGAETPTGGGAPEPRPVRVAPAPDTPTTNPPSADRRWQLRLDPKPDGRLVVRRSALTPHTPLLRITTGPDGLEITCAAEGDVPALALLREGRVRATVPAHHSGPGTVTAVVGDVDVPPGPGATYAVAADTGADLRPVMRDRNELRDPSAGTLMPKVFGDLDGAELVVTRYSIEGQLLVQRPGPA